MPKTLRVPRALIFFQALALIAGLLLSSCGSDEKNKESASSEATTRPRLDEARRLMQKKDYETARTVVEDVILGNRDKEDTEALFVMGLIYLKMDRRGDALKMAERITAADPNYGGAYSLLAESHYLVSRFDDAVEEARKALQLDPKQPLAYKVIGEIYLRQGKTTDSIHVLEAAQGLAPDDIEILTKLGSAYIKGGEHQKALTVLKIAYALDPKVSGIHFNLAMVYNELKDGGNAMFHINEAEKLYTEEENLPWVSKARHIKRALAKEYKMRPEDIGH